LTDRLLKRHVRRVARTLREGQNGQADQSGDKRNRRAADSSFLFLGHIKPPGVYRYAFAVDGCEHDTF
jgi:hypothetical protein